MNTDLTFLSEVILIISSGLTSIISAVVGMAGGIVLLSLMTFFMPLNIIVPIHGMVQLVSNSTRSWFLKEHIIWPIFKWYLLGLPIGTALAVYVIKSINRPELFYILVVLLILYTVFKPKKLPMIKIPFWSFFIIALIVGFMGPLVGASGPFQAPFFLRDDFSKENIVATKASVQSLGHLLKFPAFLYLGFDYLNYLTLIFLMALMSIIGTKYGVKLLGKIDELVFTIMFKLALLFAAVRICYKLTQI